MHDTFIVIDTARHLEHFLELVQYGFGIGLGRDEQVSVGALWFTAGLSLTTISTNQSHGTTVHDGIRWYRSHPSNPESH